MMLKFDHSYVNTMKTTKVADFAKVINTDKEPTKKQILDGLHEAVKEVKAIKSGKKKAVLLKDFLKEL